MFVVRIFLVFFLWLLVQVTFAQEICGNCTDDDGDGLIDCYDPECRNDTVFCKNFYLGVLDSSERTTCADQFELTEIWSRLGTNYDFSELIAGDIDGDGIPELLVRDMGPGLDRTLQVLDGTNGVLKNSISDSTVGHCIGDVDKDGYGEIFGYKNSPLRVVRYEHDLTITWTSVMPVAFTQNLYLSLADFDGNDTAEVYFGGLIVNAITGNVLVNGNSQLSFPFSGNGQRTIAADVLPDNACAQCAGLELINGKKVFAVDLQAGTLTLIASGPAGLPDGHGVVADFNVDGALDIIINAKDTIYVFDPRTNMLIGAPYTYNGPAFPNHQNLLVGNLDNDPGLEIGRIINDRYFVVDDDMTLKWQNTTVYDASHHVPSVMFDFNCDGMQEIVVRGEDGSLHIIRGYDGQILSSIACGPGGTGAEYPIIVDINADGHADIVRGCYNGIESRLIAWTGAAPNSWAPSRKVWNQYVYMNTQINDDLTIPCGQQNHATEGLPAALNTFYGQAPLFDEQGRACQKNPAFVDALMQIDTMIHLNCNTVNILYSICNTGTDSTIQPGTNYTIYKDSALQKIIIVSDSIPIALGPGQCWSSNIILQADGSKLSFYANDDGRYPSYAPIFSFVECDYSNNMDTITIDSILVSSTNIESDDSIICSGDATELRATEISNASYQWSDGTTGASTIITDSGTYWVSLSVPPGCTSSDTLSIGLKPEEECLFSFYIPNSFSPNGDGKNDVLSAQANNLNKFKWIIFDRIGNVIFESDNINNGWDGIFNGRKTDSGIFTYYVEVESLKGEIKTYKGNITMLD